MGLRASSRSAPTGPGKTLALTPLRRLPGHTCSLCQASVTSFCLTKGLWGPREETKESSSHGGCFTHMTTKGRGRDLPKVAKGTRGGRLHRPRLCLPGTGVGPLRRPRADGAAGQSTRSPFTPELGLHSRISESEPAWGSPRSSIYGDLPLFLTSASRTHPSLSACWSVFSVIY